MIKRIQLFQGSLWTALLILATAGTANAATVVLDGLTATGITDLDVDPGPGVELYDVDFIQTTAGALYGNPPTSTFPFSPVDSVVVNDAILAALVGSSATSVGPDSGTTELGYAFMYFSEEDERNNVTFSGAGGLFVFGTGWTDNGLVTEGDTTVLIYADFAPSTVIPVPAAAWLFGSGLLGLIGFARRKRAA